MPGSTASALMAYSQAPAVLPRGRIDSSRPSRNSARRAGSTVKVPATITNSSATDQSPGLLCMMPPSAKIVVAAM